MPENLEPQPWILGICSVVFDIDIGQRVDQLVPEGILSEEEALDVGFHSFPDSMSMELHAKSSIRDSSFFFRVKRRGTPARPSHYTDSHPGIVRYIYGFVFCRQRQDPSLRRGGDQVSIVVLSEHPLSGVMTPLSGVVGPLYFSMGPPALTQVYQEVCQWPPPFPGITLQLHVGYVTLSARVPSFSGLPYPSVITANEMLQGKLGLSPLLQMTTIPSYLTVGLDCHSGRTSHNNLLLPNHLDSENLGVSPEADSAPLASLPGPPSSHIRTLSEQFSTRSMPDLLSTSGSQDVPPSGRKSAVHSAGNSNVSNYLANDSEALRNLGSPPQSAGPSLHAGYSGYNEGTRWRSAAESITARNVISPPLSSGPSLNLGSSDGTRWRNAIESLTIRNIGSPTQSAGPSLNLGSNDGTKWRSASSSITGASNISEPVIPLGPFSEVDIYTPLASQCASLWHLWELTLLARPLLVVAPSPGESAATVAAIVSLIAPLPYAPDFRPYLTLHDPCFTALSEKVMPGTCESEMCSDDDLEDISCVPTLIGITNLYFVRALAHWPHILSVGKKEISVAKNGQWSPLGFGQNAMSVATGAVRFLAARTKGPASLLADHCENLWSSYSPITRPEPALLARLLPIRPTDPKARSQRNAFVNSETIRRHFHTITTALLAPFNRYFEPGPTGNVPPWSPEEFLFSVRSSQPSQVLLERCRTVAALVELYARLLASPNFKLWWRLYRGPVEHLAEQTSSGTNGLSGFARAAAALDEVSLVNMLVSVEEAIVEQQKAMAAADPEEPTLEATASLSRLKQELMSLFLALSEDMQLAMISSPSRRDLLLALPFTTSQRAHVDRLLKLLETS